MTATSSAMGAAIDYLATAAAAAFPAPIQVVDGPVVTDTMETATSRIWVGADPDNPDAPAAEGDQEFAALGARSRNETFAIVNTVDFWSGNTVAAPVRAGAFALLRTFELLIRGTNGNPGDTRMGGAVLWSQIAGDVAYHQIDSSDGLIGRIVFHVSCMARLTS